MIRSIRFETSRATLLAAACAILVPTESVRGAPGDWAEGKAGRSSGASRDYYNSAARLAWRNFMGDWHDAAGVAQGDKAFAKVSVADTDRARDVEWDVTALVRQWHEGKLPNKGFFLRATTGGGKIVFCSREHAEAEHHPRLFLLALEGSHALPAQADTFLTRSTYRSQGHLEELSVSGGPDPALLRFTLPDFADTGPINKAILRLHTVKQYGAAEIGVFRCSQGHELPPSDPVMGLAAGFSRDEGIAKHDEVLFATGFEAENWSEEWTYAGDLKVIDVVSADAVRKFAPFQRKALRVKIAKGNTGALNTLYKFGKEVGAEPEEIYFRYYLRLGADWKQTVQGGKMPGISGTYGRAGWGGRKVNGTDGWSARGSFDRTIPEGNPLAGLHPLGTYCYHAEMKGQYGDSWGWHLGHRGFLENNRWYAIEQHLKLNTPGKKDGVLRAWIDGRLAFEKSDIRFRDVAKLKIEQIWMNVYHGGTTPSPHDQHLFIDNVVIAKKYIGPVRGASGGAISQPNPAP